METPKIKSVEELAKKYVSLCDIIHDGEAYKEMEKAITQDRASIHTSLVAAVEGKKYTEDQGIDAEMESYNAALDDILTIINSIFKE